jgi:hypothetical protein
MKRHARSSRCSAFRAEILALINTTASGVFMVTSLVTKHFGFEKEWQEAQRRYGEWGEQKQGEIRPPEGI